MGKIPAETLVILRAQFLVHLVRDNIQCIEAVHPDTSLEAAGRTLPEQALHLDFINQILSVLVQVGKAVDALTREGRCGCHQFSVFRMIGQLIRHCHCVERGSNHGMVNVIFNLFPKHKNAFLDVPKAFQVIFSGYDHQAILSCKWYELGGCSLESYVYVYHKTRYGDNWSVLGKRSSK